MKTCIKRFELPNGVVVTMYDETRRYYEDYHVVRLEMVCETAVRREYFDNNADFADAARLLGDAAVFRKTIEKMGVPYAEIGQARERMMAGVENNCRSYFSRDSFPCKLVVTELARARDRNRRQPC